MSCSYTFTKLLMLFICYTKLVEGNRMKKALHDGVEEACISPVLHGKCYPFSFLINVCTFHQLYNIRRAWLLHFALEIIFIFFPLFSFEFELSSSFWADSRNLRLSRAKIKLLPFWQEFTISWKCTRCSRHTSLFRSIDVLAKDEWIVPSAIIGMLSYSISTTHL